MANWKTTLAGLLGAILSVILPMISGGTVAPKDIAIAATLAGVGFLAKDNNVTGGTVVQF